MRGYGILLHIASLPSAWGIGDLGPAAHAFAQLLAGAGARLWQFLPLNPTSTFIGNSPYSSPSAFAGNSLFISPELLVHDGWISSADLDCSFAWLPDGRISADPSRIHYKAVTQHREYLLNAAFERACPRLARHEAFQEFIREHAYWLTDYARFISIKDSEGGRAWTEWPEPLKRREPQTLAAWDARAAHAILREQFVQYLFFSQWALLRETCARAEISLLADIPIYVTHDSADVWANPDFFKLDENMHPVTVSGVPPDYFSETGQRWGSPIYRWNKLADDGFTWWKKRLSHTLLLADMARLDHFRGFCGYWEIDASAENAINGIWRKAPGRLFFTAMREHLHHLPFLAENLGVITDDVHALMRDFDLPGMHVLQFAFSGADAALNPDIPFRHVKRSFVYTGTHDNTPTLAWFETATDQERANFAAYAGVPVSGLNAVQALTGLAFASASDWAVLPMQDVLRLGEEGRMNVPGVPGGNWTWRMRPEEAEDAKLTWVNRLARIYGRLPGQQGGDDFPLPEYA